MVEEWHANLIASVAGQVPHGSFCYPAHYLLALRRRRVRLDLTHKNILCKKVYLDVASSV
jgi:hypothetical protein